MTSGGYAEVIGDPIRHSKSPIIHRFWLTKLGLDFDYRTERVSRAQFPAYLEQRRSDRAWRGCNVTMPLKLDAILLADQASDRAVAAGAANLLVRQEGMLVAGNTDVGGVLQVIGPRLEQNRDSAVTLLGTGGAARAVLVALRMLGAESVQIQARNLSAAYKLAVEFGLRLRPSTFDVPVETEGLVNATPVGMTGTEPFEFDIQRMPTHGWVFDMVTDPVETALLRSARHRGLTAIDGLSMLVEQAAASFMLLFGHEAPRQFDDELMARLRT